MKRNVLTGLCLLLFCTVCSVQGYSVPDGNIVFTSGEKIGGTGGITYSCFRIPAIVRTNNGTLVAFVEGRRFDCEDEGNRDIVMARSTDNGRNWTKSVLCDDGGNRLHNPVPVYDSINDKIVLVYGKNGSQVYKYIGSNNGSTWSGQANISASVTPPDALEGISGTGPSHGIRLLRGEHAGRIVVPYRYKAGGFDKIRLAYSDNSGSTWSYSTGRLTSEGTNYGLNEVAIAELTNGDIYFNIRNANAVDESERYRVVCRTDGDFWDHLNDYTPLEFDTMLPEPTTGGGSTIGCAGSLLKVASYGYDGHLYNQILFANPASKTLRKYLTIRSSVDEAETCSWSEKKMMSYLQCGYSDMVSLANNNAGILYETGFDTSYEYIVFVRFHENWVTESEIAAYEFNEKPIGSYATSSDEIRNSVCLGLNGAVTGSIKYVAGPDSSDPKALEFDSTEYITIDDSQTNNVLDFSADDTFWIEAKIKTTSHGSGGSVGSGAIIAKDNSIGTEPQWWLRVEDGHAKFLVCDGEGHQPSVTSSIHVNDGAWNYICAGRDAVNHQLFIYVNTPVNQVTVPDTTTADLKDIDQINIRIGNFNNYSRQFLGKISFVRVLFTEY